jgi:hypothetical protein
MIIQLEIPDELPEGHGASFKKGVADSLIRAAETPLEHTPNGHEHSRERGKEIGIQLVAEVAKIVKKPKS